MISNSPLVGAVRWVVIRLCRNRAFVCLLQRLAPNLLRSRGKILVASLTVIREQALRAKFHGGSMTESAIVRACQ